MSRAAAAVWNDELQGLLEDWHRRVTTAQFGHQRQADRYRALSLVFGIPVVVLTTLVGTSAFAAVTHGASKAARIAVGVVSIMAAVLASIQTFLGYGQSSERHRIAGARYASLRRSIEQALGRHDPSFLDRLRTEMDKVGAASPQIGRRTWKHAQEDADAAIREWRRGEGKAVATLERPEDRVSL
jgi:conflict system pore-forming effector with SLATT domain